MLTLYHTLCIHLHACTHTHTCTYTLGTHDGSFHCDEALALSLLKILPEYRNSDILRSRNPELLSQCHLLADVGAIFDPETRRFDHHQKEFTGVLQGYNTKLSSAGLVYQHFGREILKEILTIDNLLPKDDFVEICFHKLYKGFIEHIDAIDNGISVSDETPRFVCVYLLLVFVYILMYAYRCLYTYIWLVGDALLW